MKKEFLPVIAVFLLVLAAGCTSPQDVGSDITGAAEDVMEGLGSIPGGLGGAPDVSGVSVPAASEFGLPEYPGATYLEDKSKQYTSYQQLVVDPKYAERIYITDDDFSAVVAWYEAQLGMEIPEDEMNIMGDVLSEAHVTVDMVKDVDISIRYPETASIAGSDGKIGIHFIMNFHDYE